MDRETQDVLPAANIQIAGTFRGTITNNEGDFTLNVDERPAVLLIRYIGYETERVEVTGETPDYIEITLEPVVYEFDEVVVTDQDLAVSIMQKVIERKQAWQQTLETYEAEAYNRFTLENDTGIVSILESATDVYWNREAGFREVVKGQRQTSNLDFDEFIPAAMLVANLYDDDIEMAGYTFIGVTHPDALKHYDFALQGYRIIDEQLIYDIRVEPRNKFKTAFSGQVSVLDEEYALIEVQLQPGEAFRFPPPVNAFDVVFEQQYSNFGGTYWLPVDFRSEMELEVGFGRLLSLPTIFVDQVSRIGDYLINVPLPDSLLESDDNVVVDSVAVADNARLDAPGSSVPLNKAEMAAYETIDSTMTLEKAYKPRGTLARFIETDDDEGASSRTDRSALDLEFDGLLRFNRVEGLYGELGVRRSLGRRLSLNAAGGYSTAQSGDDRFSYSLGSRFGFGRRPRAHLEASYARYTDTQTPASPGLRFLNGAFMLFGGTDYFDYYRSERFRVGLDLRFSAVDARAAVGVRLEDHTSLEKETDYDLLGGSAIQRLNPGVDEGALRSVEASIAFGDEDDAAGFTGRRSLILSVEHSSPSLMDSEFDFTTLKGTLVWQFDTFFARRLLPNSLDIYLEGMTHAGDVPLQRLGAIDGSIEIIGRFGTMKTLDTMPYRGDRSLAFFWEHNFRTVPFELLGMDRLAERALNLIVFGGHGRSWLPGRWATPAPGEAEGLVFDSAGWHHEVGLSLSGVFSIVRIDVAQRLDEPGFFIGIGTARIF